MIAGPSRASRLRQYLHGIGVAAILACSTGIVAAHQAYADNAAQEAFPLWIEVPGARFATLDHGQLPNGTKWGSYVSRVGGGHTNTKYPCVTVARLSAIGGFLSASDCGALIGSSAGGSEVPLYASISETYQNVVNGPVRSETVMALLFGQSVARVVLTSAAGTRIGVHTRLLNRRQRGKSGVGPLRFVALALMREVCAEELQGYDFHGTELFSARPEVCPQH
jgi:hypothetical protein